MEHKIKNKKQRSHGNVTAENIVNTKAKCGNSSCPTWLIIATSLLTQSTSARTASSHCLLALVSFLFSFFFNIRRSIVRLPICVAIFVLQRLYGHLYFGALCLSGRLDVCVAMAVIVVCGLMSLAYKRLTGIIIYSDFG